MEIGKKKPTTKSQVVSSAPEKKFKILCLHGYRQNANTFKLKTGAFRKCFKNNAEFVYISAPHKVPSPSPPAVDQSKENPCSEEKIVHDDMLKEQQPNNNDDDINEEDKNEIQNSWWFNKDDGTFKGTNQNGPAIGFEQSVELVKNVWHTQGPFDGIFGFSQGACFAGLLCYLSKRQFIIDFKIKFVILASGFCSGSLAHRQYYGERLKIPSLHVFGSTDNIITNDMSIKLTELFEQPSIHEHSGGHYVPATSETKLMYNSFMKTLISMHLQDEEDGDKV